MIPFLRDQLDGKCNGRTEIHRRPFRPESFEAIAKFALRVPAVIPPTPTPTPTATATPAPTPGGDGGEGGGQILPPGLGALPDKAPPTMRIVKGPFPKNSRRPKFEFLSTETGSRVQCKVDRRPFLGCKSGAKLRPLKPGRNTFAVRAINVAGNVDPTPATRRFRLR